ncbi:hypothetical protein CALVIDRAFT_477038 [Calocera viscosa TUFC12733]|uniref:Integrase core domain-containing protein n=1 Tax=Calocera viscosa (strain TUFC12733) TaxID=1330018 RepID=A0A167QH10_CALVF|nr:hypothetical protein CALVIDRAFT_477038 [Calocera viscosa TUFC12733]
MVQHRGSGRGSYLWGRSVHNTRIERMWVDVTDSFGRKWSELFSVLEASHGLNPLNEDHIWLLHWLFIDDINDDAIAFQNEWNYHTMSLPGRNQTPSELFLAGCLENGARGIPLQSSDDEEFHRSPQRYGAEDMDLDTIPIVPADLLPNFGFLPTVGALDDQVPLRLNSVQCPPPGCPFSFQQMHILEVHIYPRFNNVDQESLVGRWCEAYIICSSF